MWHTVGDSNSNFYHILTKQRRAMNMIIGLDYEGTIDNI